MQMFLVTLMISVWLYKPSVLKRLDQSDTQLFIIFNRCIKTITSKGPSRRRDVCSPTDQFLFPPASCNLIYTMLPCQLAANSPIGTGAMCPQMQAPQPSGKSGLWVELTAPQPTNFVPGGSLRMWMEACLSQECALKIRRFGNFALSTRVLEPAHLAPQREPSGLPQEVMRKISEARAPSTRCFYAQKSEMVCFLRLVLSLENRPGLMRKCVSSHVSAEDAGRWERPLHAKNIHKLGNISCLLIFSGGLGGWILPACGWSHHGTSPQSLGHFGTLPLSSSRQMTVKWSSGREKESGISIADIFAAGPPTTFIRF